jgi:hypothetical protein
MKHFFELGIIESITKKLLANGVKDKVIELVFGEDSITPQLTALGIKCKAVEWSRLKLPKCDVVVCLNRTPWETIPSGTRLITVSYDYQTHEACVAAIHPYMTQFTTIQHGYLFLTEGLRK